MESEHSADGPTSREFSSIYIVRELWGLKSKVVEDFPVKLPFLKNDPLRENFHNFVPKGFTASRIHVLCENFVTFGRPEVGEIARCLLDKKTKFRLALSLSLLRRSRPKSARPAANSVLRVPQISSISVYFRQSYSRTREHRSNAP